MIIKIDLHDENTWPKGGDNIIIDDEGNTIAVGRIQVAEDSLYEYDENAGWLFKCKDSTELLVEDANTRRWYGVEEYSLVQS